MAILAAWGRRPAPPGFFHCCAFTFLVLPRWRCRREHCRVVPRTASPSGTCGHWMRAAISNTSNGTNSSTLAKAIETDENEDGTGYPAEEGPAGCRAKCSPVYQRLKDKGARFGARGFWELRLTPTAWHVSGTGSNRPAGRAGTSAVLCRECRAVHERVRGARPARKKRV